MIFRYQKSQKKTKGSVLIEMAVAAPILLLLIFGFIEITWVLYAKHNITAAAREGARVLALQNPSSDALTTVENYLGNLGYNSGSFNVIQNDPDPACGFPPSFVDVTVQLDLDSVLLFGNIYGIFVAGSTLDSTVTMYKECPDTGGGAGGAGS